MAKLSEILVFGNPLIKQDSIALIVAKELEGKIKGVTFKEISSISELEQIGDELGCLDVIQEGKKVAIFGIENIKSGNVFSSHDFDLGFELKLLKKLGKIKSAKIIGIPMNYNKEKAVKEVREILVKNKSN